MRRGLRYRKVWSSDAEVQVPRHCFVVLFPLDSTSTLLGCIFTRNTIHLETTLSIFCPSFLGNPARLVTGQHIRRYLQTVGAAEMEDITSKAVNVVLSKQGRGSLGHSLGKRRAGWLVYHPTNNFMLHIT